MEPSLDSLRAKVSHIERELAEVRHELNQLEPPAPTATSMLWSGWPRTVDKTALVRWFDDWFGTLGTMPEPVGPERLQEMTRRQGLRPEQNLLSSGITDARDE